MKTVYFLKKGDKKYDLGTGVFWPDVFKDKPKTQKEIFERNIKYGPNPKTFLVLHAGSAERISRFIKNEEYEFCQTEIEG